jgi:hypothetical protein
MIKIAVFTEGQSELIFIRHILFLIYGYEKISIRCLKLHGGKEIPVPYDHHGINPHIFFQIINLENDERVLSTIKEREFLLLARGFYKIIGLRDLYSETYDRRTNGRIDITLNQKFINAANEEISQMSQPEKIKIFFAIMEFEAWLLGMYNLFIKINSLLTLAYIEKKLNLNLKKIDPQNEFFRPGKQLNKILNLISLDYDKSKDILEKICSRVEVNDLENIIENGRCSAFREFFDEIKFIKERH